MSGIDFKRGALMKLCRESAIYKGDFAMWLPKGEIVIILNSAHDDFICDVITTSCVAGWVARQHLVPIECDL